MNRRKLLDVLRGLVAPPSQREQHLASIAAIWSPRRVDEALALAIEAGKLGLRPRDLLPMVQAWHWLNLLGLRPEANQGFFDWATKHGLVTHEQLAAAELLDLLGMQSDSDEKQTP